MAKRSMVLKLTNINQATPEGVTLEDNNAWKSPGGGWLPTQNGVWDQLPDGVHLHTSTKTKHVAVLKGLNFFTSKTGDTGDALYPTLGDRGKWRVEDVVQI